MSGSATGPAAKTGSDAGVAVATDAEAQQAVLEEHRVAMESTGRAHRRHLEALAPELNERAEALGLSGLD